MLQVSTRQFSRICSKQIRSFQFKSHIYLFEIVTQKGLNFIGILYGHGQMTCSVISMKYRSQHFICVIIVELDYQVPLFELHFYYTTTNIQMATLTLSATKLRNLKREKYKRVEQCYHLVGYIRNMTGQTERTVLRPRKLGYKSTIMQIQFCQKRLLKASSITQGSQNILSKYTV